MCVCVRVCVFNLGVGAIVVVAAVHGCRFFAFCHCCRAFVVLVAFLLLLFSVVSLLLFLLLLQLFVVVVSVGVGGWVGGDCFVCSGVQVGWLLFVSDGVVVVVVAVLLLLLLLLFFFGGGGQNANRQHQQ